MKLFKIVMLVVLSAVLLFLFIECSGYGARGSSQDVETSSGTVDVSPIPANSEFLKE